MDQQGNAVEPEDFRDEYHCEHGTFIGNPFGGDYMCGYCEDGVTHQEYLEIRRQLAADFARDRIHKHVLDLLFVEYGTLRTFRHVNPEEYVSQAFVLLDEAKALSDDEALSYASLI